MQLNLMEAEFEKQYNKKPASVFFCPGRVNLIGEHIDYNGGLVLPCAISKGTYLAVSSNDKQMMNFKSLNFDEELSIAMEGVMEKLDHAWYNYPLGVLYFLKQQGHELPGYDFLFYGDLPIGAGLSSSASIELVTAFAINTIHNLNISGSDLALLGQKVETTFIGLNSGIMDQFAVSLGKKDRAMLLNCDTQDYEYFPIETGDHTLVIINSNKKRTLADSKYNERFAECRAALALLQKEFTIQHLCEISSEQLDTHKHLISDSVLLNRATHVVSENERVKASVNFLKSGDLASFGEMLYASHESLKTLYEVSGIELDTIVEFCKSYPDCIGARMTGAGFGGCAIALVKTSNFEDFSEKLKAFYLTKIGYEPGVFISEIEDGVRQVN